MRKVLRSLAIVLAFVGASQAHAQMAVIDIPNLEQSIQQVVSWGKQYQQMIMQLQQLEAQYQQLQTTYNSLTGSRGLATLLNGGADQALRRYLPADAQQIEQLASGAVSGFGPLQSAVNNLKSVVSRLPASTFANGTDAFNTLAAKVNSLATQKALGQAAFTSAAQRTTDIENLIATSGGANDPKAIAEMQTRISAQQALLQNESAKLQAMAYMQAAETQQNDQRANETISQWGKTTLPAISF